MPYEHVEPERFLEHDGVTVYHVYHAGCLAEYWYTTNPADDDLDNQLEDGEAGQFDVRDMASKVTALSPYLRSRLEALPDHRIVDALIIREAIDAGLLAANR